MSETKRRILVWADSPTVATGFAQVSRNILRELHKTGRYEIDMIGINFYGEYSRKDFEEKYPYINAIVPAQQLGNPDMYGREYLLATIMAKNPAMQPPYDIFFSIQDHFIIQQKDGPNSKSLAQAIKILQKNTLNKEIVRQNHFLWVGYFPVDGQLKEIWVTESIGLADFPVAYCEYGHEQIMKFDNKEIGLKDRLGVIYHGTNTEDFYPYSKGDRSLLRQQLFKNIEGSKGSEVTDKTFILMSVARNQPRKDLFKTLQIFKEWLKEEPDSVLYFHCDPTDRAGGNLFDMATGLGLDLNRLRFSNGFKSASRGVTLDVLNKYYNCADAFITTSLGEGWGLPITEAMACKVPVFAPGHTSINDILDTHDGFNQLNSRGMAFKAGSTPTEWVNFGNGDNEVARPISNVESAIEMLKWARDHKNTVDEIVKRAYDWVLQHTWEIECKKWIDLFDQACEINDQLRSGGPQTEEKAGRNDPCPACLEQGVTKKLKRCEQHRDLYLK